MENRVVYLPVEEQKRIQVRENMHIVTEREIRGYRWKMRRRRQIRNRIAFFFLTAFLVLGSVLFCKVIISNAETKEQTVYYKYYTSVSAPYGATLWSLSKDYLDEIHYESIMDYIEEVKKINHLADDGIKAGQRIIFPYYSSEYIE